MTYLERTYAGILVVTTAIFGWYFLDIVLNMPFDQASVSDFAPRMWFMMALYIVLVIVTAIVNGIWQRGAIEEFDERDRIIDMRTEEITSHIQGFAILGILALVLFEFSTVIIAHALLGAMVVSTLFSTAWRLYLYRRGV